MKIKTLLPILLFITYYLDFKFQIVVPTILGIIALGVLLTPAWLQRITVKTNIRLLQLMLLLFPIYILLIQFARLKIGSQGVDFAIFSQVVANASDGAGLQTSLIDYAWHDFLTHHFSPYLYLVGLVSSFGLGPQLALIILYVATISLSLILAYQIIRSKHSLLVSLLTISLIILLPAIRISLLWEVRDEIYALPLILGAFLAIIRDRHYLAIGLLASGCIFKETIFLIAFGFSLSVLIKHHYLMNKPLHLKVTVCWIAFSLISLFGFLLYSVILPYWTFWPTFNLKPRIASVSDFLQMEFILAKLKWCAVTISPLIPIVIYLVRKKESYLPIITKLVLDLLPVMPLFLAIAISNFQPMYNPFTYYSVVPVFFTTVILIYNLNAERHRRLSSMLTIAIVLAALLGHHTKGLSDLKIALTQESPYSEIEQLIPSKASVITDDYETNFFIHHHKVTRIFHANQNNLKFDFIVQRKNGPDQRGIQQLNKFYRSWSEVCFENANWVVRCAYPSQQPI